MTLYIFSSVLGFYSGGKSIGHRYRHEQVRGAFLEELAHWLMQDEMLHTG